MVDGMLERKRFPGVDLAKIIAIYFVLIHHVSHSGVDVSILFNGDAANHPCLAICFKMLHNISYSCIDLFALATGFLCVGSVCKYSRIVNLWLSAFFWGLTILFVCKFVGYSIPLKYFFNAAFPIWRDQYWFLTAYFMMFFFMPFLNKGIKAMSRRECHHLFTVIAIFICGYSIYSCGDSIYSRDLFSLRGGYSFPWLCIVYLIGAYIRIFNPCHWRASACFVMAAIIVVITTFLYLALCYYIPSVRFGLISYVSASTLGIAIFIFLGCLKLNIGERMGRFLKTVSATTFGVYLIHVQPFVWKNVWHEKFHQIKIESALQLAVVVIGFSIITFILLTSVEHLRLLLFEKCGVNRLIGRVDDVIKR